MDEPKPTPQPYETWHHVKGYFVAIVDAVYKANNRIWVRYFIEENCDETHAQHEGAYVEQRLTNPLDLAKERFFESNTLHVAVLERFHRKFRPDPHPNPIKIPERIIKPRMMVVQVTTKEKERK
jgi:hypothetical protein